jgi:hypothetical protein
MAYASCAQSLISVANTKHKYIFGYSGLAAEPTLVVHSRPIQARTPLSVEVDADLVISRSLSSRLLDRNVSAQVLQGAKSHSVFIVPAFDIGPGVDRIAMADALASTDKVL